MAILTQKAAPVDNAYLIKTLLSGKTPILKIAESSDHNIDPWI
jgi:hypothetical protein